MQINNEKEMKTILIEILKIILPAIVTGMFTFFVTKYNYNRNVPLDKMETAYNEIYYPIYKLLNEQKIFNNVNVEEIILITSKILNKHGDYADRSTLNAFRLLNDLKNKEVYENFRNNILKKYLYLRRRLGYLEPNIFQIYIYSSKTEKFTFRIFMEILAMYICIFFTSILKGKYQERILFIFILLLITILCEILIKIIKWVICKIRKLHY